MRLPMTWELAELVRQRAGLRLSHTQYTVGTTVDEDSSRQYFCGLYGPYLHVPGAHGLAPDHDQRIFVCYRTLEGHTSMELIVQDADDDAFLNRNAAGAEKFNVGPIAVSS